MRRSNRQWDPFAIYRRDSGAQQTFRKLALSYLNLPRQAGLGSPCEFPHAIAGLLRPMQTIVEFLGHVIDQILERMTDVQADRSGFVKRLSAEMAQIPPGSPARLRGQEQGYTRTHNAAGQYHPHGRKGSTPLFHTDLPVSQMSHSK
jgi:hypothetical protein